MKRRGLVRGEAIALVSALALFAALFTDWYGAEVAGQVGTIALGGGTDAGGNAWQSLEGISILLAVIVVFVVGAVALRPLGSKWQPVVPLNAAIAVLGGLATLVILLRILFPPDFGTLGGVPVNATLELGPFLGLATAALIAYGGYRAMGERGTSFEKIADSLSRKPASGKPSRS